MTQVFISYTKSDEQFAERLTIDLKQAGIDVWFGAWEIKVGDSIVDKVEKALSENDYFIIILSSLATKSKWVRRELNVSLMQNLGDRKISILPVLRENCVIPTIISDLKYADFSSDYRKGIVELLQGIGFINTIPAYFLPTYSLIDDIDNDSRNGNYSKFFPYSFSDYPGCLFPNGKLDVVIIVGATEREHSDETEIFRRNRINIDIFGTNWNFSRQVSPGTVRDTVRVADLAAFLGFCCGKYSDSKSFWPNEYNSICLMDITVNSDVLNRNIILVGGADTNVFIPIVSVAFRQKFGCTLPVRYYGEDQLYFTCDQIFSEMSKKVYSRLEDSSYMHCGYVLMVANPWNPKKVVIFVVGTRATGTQAALLAMIRKRDYVPENQLKSEPWHNLAYNNRYNSNIPGKIVRARQSEIVDGESYIHSCKKITVSDKERISQRHIITNFEFLE